MSLQPTSDIFVGVEDSKPKVETQPPTRDPRLQRDPRLALKDPRVVRDPRIRPKPTQSELLPSGEPQPTLTFFGPVTNQPLNQLGPETSEPPLLPPVITPLSLAQPNRMLPHPMPAASLPHPMPKAPPLVSDVGNQNSQVIKEEPMDHKPVTPKKDSKPRHTDIKKERITPEKSQLTTHEIEKNLKVEKSEAVSSSKEKKRKSDTRKLICEGKSKELKEMETKDKNGSSSSERKVAEIIHDKSKRVNDPRKGVKEEDHGRSDTQRGKSKRNRGDEVENRRKIDERSSENRERSKNYEAHSRRSKSPRPRSSLERSRSPVKGKGSKRETKNRNKTENKGELKNKKLTEESREEQKTEQRLPISSLPRIPKRAGSDIDDRNKDLDDRRLSCSNKRDLDERHDLKISERSNKKPRISQERDLGPVKVETHMTEDIR